MWQAGWRAGWLGGVLAGHVHGTGDHLTQQGYLATSTEKVLCCHLDLPLRLFLFGTSKDHPGPRAISKIMKWVKIVVCS